MTEGRPVLVPSGQDASVVKIDGVFGQTMRSDDATYLKVRRGRRIVSVAVIIASASTPMVYAKCPAWKSVPLRLSRSGRSSCVGLHGAVCVVSSSPCPMRTKASKPPCQTSFPLDSATQQPLLSECPPASFGSLPCVSVFRICARKPPFRQEPPRERRRSRFQTERRAGPR